MTIDTCRQLLIAELELADTNISAPVHKVRYLWTSAKMNVAWHKALTAASADGDLCYVKQSVVEAW
jgi:hypothetical protein